MLKTNIHLARQHQINSLELKQTMQQSITKSRPVKLSQDISRQVNNYQAHIYIYI